MRSIRTPLGPDEIEVPASPVLIAAPPGLPLRGLGFRLPSIAGVPDPDTLLARAIHCAIDAASFSHLPAEEVKATLSSLAETVRRARYHRLRFDACLAAAKQRRAALGGPVVADWHAIPPLICEATALFGAIRTAVDLLVYIAARRAGKSESSADSWDAKEAIQPTTKPGDMPPSRYDLPEVLEIRVQQGWFEELNLYRNVFYHRGLGGDRFGFYARSDTANEATDPDHNAALLPDLSALRTRARPHQWTYTEQRRLDELVESVDTRFTDLLTKIVCGTWSQPIPAPGSASPEAQPNALLLLPRTVLLRYPGRNVLPVFTTKPAARAFTAFGPSRHDLELRAVRPTRMGTEPRVFLLPVVPGTACTIEIYALEDGRLRLVGTLPFDASQENDLPGVVRLYVEDISALYLWQAKATP